MRRRKKSDDVKLQYTEIINYIEANSKIPKVKNVSYYIKHLKREGIVKKLGYGVWQINKDKKDQMQFQQKVIPKSTKILPVTNKEIRGHGFAFSVVIPPTISSSLQWSKREEMLSKKKIAYSLVGPSWKAPQFEYKEHKVWLTKKKAIIFFPTDKSYFSESAYEAQKFATYDVLTIIKHLEKLIQVSLKINKEYALSVSRQHYGKVNDELAKIANTEKAKISLIGNDGKQWLLVDNSLNMNELETVHAKRAANDMEKVVKPFYNDLRDHYEKTGESLTIGKLKDIVSDLTKTLTILTQRQSGLESNQEKSATQILEMATGLNAVSKSLKIMTQPKIQPDEEPGIKEKPFYVG